MSIPAAKGLIQLSTFHAAIARGRCSIKTSQKLIQTIHRESQWSSGHAAANTSRKKRLNYGFYCSQFSSVKLWMINRVAERERSVLVEEAVHCYGYTALAIHKWVRGNVGMTVTEKIRSARRKKLSQFHFINHKSHMDWRTGVKGKGKDVPVQAKKTYRGIGGISPPR